MLELLVLTVTSEIEICANCNDRYTLVLEILMLTLKIEVLLEILVLTLEIEILWCWILILSLEMEYSDA